MIARLLAIGAGAAILATVAHVNITVTGGYGTPHSWVTIAVAGGVAVGSLVSPVAWLSSRRLAVCLVISMVCGEGYQLLSTAERLVKGRELDQAPLRENQKEHAKASKRVNDAKAAIDRASATSKRLEDAKAAKAAADRAAVEKSAERGCRENCRQLLQAQVDAAAGEVDRARAEIDNRKAAGERELEAARAALAALGRPYRRHRLQTGSAFRHG